MKNNASKREYPASSRLGLAILCFSILILFGCVNREVTLSDSVPEIDKTQEAKILTAFFGLDNALTPQALAIHWSTPGKDGMPLVFSLEIDPGTLDPGDFEVISMDGTLFTPDVVSLLPAREAYELRTVLLIGEYGNHPDNPPVSVKIVDDLLSRTGVNFKGQFLSVIPLEEGPILSYAEYFSFTEDYPYVDSGNGCDCPKEKTKQVVKAVWSGGVRAVNGEELGDNELGSFEITLMQDSDTIKVSPFQLADLGDNDNNTDLCLDEIGVPVLLKIKGGIAIDPRGDVNPATQIPIVSRW
ncbi:hypothetical protein [Aquiflexum lacus]|uniref:hypothetical protein n=1 Tax=Aquiflexum lacus TaxID=2483805 RepID=UPI001E420A97|nr:hypothetical protein [Aquiflexum lacus]